MTAAVSFGLDAGSGATGEAGQAGTSRRERIAAARLSEPAAEARAGRDATTIERLIVKGLTRTQAGLDGSSPSLRRRVFTMARGVERPAGKDRNRRAAVLRAAVDPM